jgi:coenzyme F420-reducing hydrogenase beta subunit
MKPDEEGFTYPYVDDTVCVNCGLCEKVCPMINRGVERNPIRTLAVKNNNENIRLNSSSGGFFSALAISIIAEGGVVFGARFNDKWEVVHDYVEKAEDLYLLRGSKYVQSIIGNAYSKAESFLKSGRKVLFSGTSCQIAGLKNYLRREYDNLLVVDVICHGVPSPMLWKDYLDYLIAFKKIKGVSSLEDIAKVSFRSKLTGWKSFSLEIVSNSGKSFIERYDKNLFFKGFLSNFYLRPSCYNCQSKKGRCGSDISLGDYWGVEKLHPQLDDDKGVGVILVYNEKYMSEILSSECEFIDSDYMYVTKSNICVERSVSEPIERKVFWRDYGAEGFNTISKIIARNAPTIRQRIVSYIRRIAKK